MDETMLISVVTPVYNGGRFLRDTYQCLCDQTYKNWEWVVVNDGSADDTDAIMQALSASDARIVYFHQKNSGSAKMPRDRAVYESKGEVILPLDADDKIEAGYLRAMLCRMQETDAAIVYPRMLFVDMPTGRVTEVLPVEDFDTKAVYRGRDLVGATLPEWRIGCNGGLYRRKVWVNMSYPGRHEPVWMNSDEVDERLYLLQAERVAFSNAEYTYQNHPESITCRVSPRQFQPLKTCLQLQEIIEQEFGKESSEYAGANRKAFYTWRSLTAHYVRHYRELSDAEGLLVANLRQCFQSIDVHQLSAGERIRFLNLCNYQLLFVLFCLKYSPRCLLEKAVLRLWPTAYRWLFIRQRMERELRQSLSFPESAATAPGTKNRETHSGTTEDSNTPFVVCMHCGNVRSGGLVDRLRGIVSTYMACRDTGRDFRIHFTHPFLLADYLQPNKYDWQIDEHELTFNPQQADTLVCDTQTDTLWERRYQRRKMHNVMEKHRNRQLHVYTNANFCYDADFAGAFHELFKPTARLAQHLDAIRQDVGGPYITVSARFCNLLDDFNEETYNEPLPLAEQDALIASCLTQLATLHRQHQDKRIIVCSDSTTFAEHACMGRDYVYVIPGTVSHIGNDRRESYEYYEKTFLDFFMIARADEAYLLRGPRMMGSGFPYAAARLGGKTCKTISF